MPLPGLYSNALARLTRRELLNVAWRLGVGAVAAPLTSTRVVAQMAFDAYPFPLGVASGDPMPDGVVLWTRLATRPLEGGGLPMVNLEVGWEVARDRAFGDIVSKGVALARPELGHSVHVEVNGLDAARDYFYRFRAGREVSQTGRTRTAPPAGASVDTLRFAMVGCNHYETGYFTAFRRIAEDHVDFVFHTGDYIYEERDNGGRTEVVRRHEGQEIYTLVDYRNRYALYKMDADLRAAHASAPFVITWDDHEVDNDYAGNRDEQGTPPEVFLLRRAAAYQAFYENMPLRSDAFPTGSDLKLYRRLTFGSLVDLSVLDTRQYRSNQACEGGAKPGCPELRDDQRTMLGPVQERWLFEELGRARARWTVIGQQVPLFARDLGPDSASGRVSTDKWDGYPVARDRLIARIVETRAPNPIVLSGDVHVHFGADLKRDVGRPDSAIIGSEFTNTSATSGGDGSDVSANWKVVGPLNPHIKYHSARRGYVACTVTPDAFRADFKVIDRVSVPNEPARTGASLLVEAGKPGAVNA